jgi:hypothetical protein
MTTQTYNPYLSKSLYMRGVQCHKALWLTKNRPELKDEISEGLQAAFDSGTEVGILAQQLFPGGVEVPYDGLTPAQQLEMTRQLMETGVTTIYEATLSHDNLFCKADILHKGENGWELYEVKASTKLKKQYPDDIAMQCHVAIGAGVPIIKASLVHIDTSYVRQGEIEVEKLFTIMDH